MRRTRFTRCLAAPLTDVLARILGPAPGRLLKFAVVGLAGVGVNSAMLALLVGFGHLTVALAGVLATEMAMLSNFALHDHWTFRDVATAGGWLGRAARYNLAALGGLLITVVVLAVLTGILHLYYLVANLFAVGSGVLWNYTLSRRFAWADAHVSPCLDTAPSTPVS